MTQAERLDYLVNYFTGESGVAINEPDKKRMLRSLMNIRPPGPLPPEILQIQDEYLLAERPESVSLEELKPIEKNIYLWQGDITRLAVDAIVNAANSALLGCFSPCHNCIDNIIHTRAGVQLRLECAKIMAGASEPMGKARITGAYNLPCRHVIHTVGPFIRDEPAEEDCRALASCYRSCLALALKNKLESIAFCCVSTGVFRFPNELAARIAIETTRAFLNENGHPINVIFDTFKDEDYAIYKRLLG